MRIVFLTNYYNHHQAPFCEFCSNLDGVDFYFISTQHISSERKKLGWGLEQLPKYVLVSSENPINESRCKVLINEADVVLLGEAPDSLLQQRMGNGKLVIRYAERIYKGYYNYFKWLPRVFKFWYRFSRLSNQYMLCASAYTAADYAKHFTFLNKTYKWGYFPKSKKYNIDDLNKNKNRQKILWCGRFLDWKHPEHVILVAEKLSVEGVSFDIDFIGTGEMEETLKHVVKEKGLENNVHFLGSMKPEQVREHMESAGIYLFTSNFQEGWGAVLNESMNSGCAVIASHAIGSVPYLIKHEENGLVYKNGNVDDLYSKVKFLLNCPDEQKRMGKNAYHTIIDLWNAGVAAERFMKLIEEIEDHGYCDLYKEGPCSRAEIIKNNWFKG